MTSVKSRDAAEHAARATDQTGGLEVKFINAYKGRGVFATTAFKNGDFVVEYRGALINSEESQRRRTLYHSARTVFMFDFLWHERWWCIDASQEDNSLGRLVNDDHKNPNCTMKTILVDGKPHLCLFAIKDINSGEEITYQYGGTDWPWREKVDKEPNVTEGVEVEHAGSSGQTPPTAKSSKKKVDKEPNVTEGVEVQHAGSSGQTPPTAKSSKKKQHLSRSSPDSSSSDEDHLLIPKLRRTKSIQMNKLDYFESDELSDPSSNDSGEEYVPKNSEEYTEDSDTSEIVETDDQKRLHVRRFRYIEDFAAAFPPVMEPNNNNSTKRGFQRGRSPKKNREESQTKYKRRHFSPSSCHTKSTYEARSTDHSGSLSEEGTSATSAPVGEDNGPSGQTPPTAKSSKKKQHLSSSSPDSSSSDEDHLLIPKLRRTKSIQMNKLDYFESDELSDPSSNDSGEEYVPKSSEEYTEDSDTSEIVETDDQKRLHVRHFKYIEDFAAAFPPVMEPNNNNSTKRGFQRGRSPKKNREESQTKCKRRHFSPKHTKSTYEARSTDHSGSSSEEGTSATSAPVGEDNGPSGPYSSDAQDGFPNVSPLIPAVEKSKNGSRIYNKRHYCLYCKKGYGKIARHLEQVHHDKPEVAQATAFPKGSRERRLRLEHLRNRGNFAHNVEVLNSGTGTLVPRKQPSTTFEPQNYIHCIYCQGLFAKKVLWRHMIICKFKPNAVKNPVKTRFQSLCAFAVPPPPGVKTELWKLLNAVNQDEVYTAVKSDELIIEYGQHLYNRLGCDASKHNCIRQKMRELGRLLIHSRKTTSMKTIEEHVNPANFMLVVESVKDWAGFVVKTRTYKCPSLALKIGHSLKTISELVESRATVQGNYRAARDARAFRNIYDSRWNELVSSASLRTRQESKWNTPQLLPFTKDVQTLHSYLSEQQQRLYNELSAEASPQTWANLSKITLTQVILFNMRRSGEVSKMPLSAYLSPNPSSDQDDLNEALSDLEKKLSEHFRRLKIKGKRGRKVPVLLTPEMQQSLDMLISKRQECGVPIENVYLFARPSAMGSFCGSDCLRYFASTCGAKRPYTLTSTKLRKQTATLSQILNLSNTELDQLANFLGHDIKVHRQFYRLPEGTLQLAKISKVLMALEKGRLAEFKGKSLDDIAIDPEESVKLDSEEEAEFEADAKEDQVASTRGQMPDARNAQTTDPGKPSQASTSKSPNKSKGRKPSKRKTWEKEEVLAVEKHMMAFITTGRLPGKADCDKCLKQEPVALGSRHWLSVKFYIKNRITALKNKL